MKLLQLVGGGIRPTIVVEQQFGVVPMPKTRVDGIGNMRHSEEPLSLRVP